MTEEQALQLEIKARIYLLKKLESVRKVIAKKAAGEQAKRQAELEMLSEYKTFDEAQEAYGWGCITEDQFIQIAEFFEKGQEAVDATKTPTDVALDTLNDFMARMQKEIKDLEWEALPEDEKERRRQANAEWKANIAEIKRRRRLA